MIKLLIFDLDNTLFDTYTQLSSKVLDDMIVRMRKAGLTEQQAKDLKSKYSYTGFRMLANELGLSPEVTKVGMEAYLYMDISHITPFDDVKMLGKFKQEKVLVTAGVRSIQEKKVDVLKLRKYFTEVLVDETSDINYKQTLFKDLMKKRNLKPKEVMVIGDNPDSELICGTRLGMVVVQVIRSDKIKLAKCDYRITDLNELTGIISKYG